MRSQDQARRRSRRTRPRIEGLEGRDLPSVAAIYFRAAALAHTRAAGGGAPSGMGGGSGMTTTGTPTPREQAREVFVAKYAGNFAVGPPRFTDQARSVLVLATGSSTAFLHGTLTLRAYPPKDLAGTVTGTATLFSRNVANTGSELSVDLQGSPGALDRAGRPTLLTWTVNGNSGGIFAGATGQGTVAIRYAPDGSGRLHAHVPDAGRAFVAFRGQVVITGTGSDLFGS